MSAPTPEYEYCEIVKVKVRLLGNPLAQAWERPHEDRFEAKAVAPNGEYIAERSPTFEGLLPFNAPTTREAYELAESRDIDIKRAFKALIWSLCADGWEDLPEKGSHWYSLKFRRRFQS